MEQVERIKVKINSRSIEAFWRGEAKKATLCGVGHNSGKKVFVHPLERVDDFSQFCMIDGVKRAIVYAESTKQEYSTYVNNRSDYSLMATCEMVTTKRYGGDFLNLPHPLPSFSIRHIESLEVHEDYMIVQFYNSCYRATSMCELFMNKKNFTHLKVKIPAEMQEMWVKQKGALVDHFNRANDEKLAINALSLEIRGRQEKLAMSHNNFDKDWSIAFGFNSKY